MGRGWYEPATAFFMRSSTRAWDNTSLFATREGG